VGRLFLFFTVLALAGSGACAYPNKPITLVVPYAAGGPTDKVARDFADGLRRQFAGTSILIDHTPGAGGTTGANKVARAPSDGHTLLLAHIGISTAPWLYKNLKYRARDDFEYLGLINEVPMTLIGRPGLPVRTFPELARWIQLNKAKVNLGHAGAGSASHLCGLLLQHGLKVDLTTIPFSGTGPAMAAMLGDQVDLMCDQATNTTAQIESGAVKGFGVTTDKRVDHPAVLSKLPTLEEGGLKNFKVTIWHGLYAPKGTPKAVLDQLNKALKAVLVDPGFIKNEHAGGAVIVTDSRSNSEDHKKFVEAETARWGVVIKASGQEYID
jgi:tripartite-type tricarboxylate transporter receptor subunit TctC